MGKKKREKSKQHEEPPTCPKCGKTMKPIKGRPMVSLFHKWMCECGEFAGYWTYGSTVKKPMQ